MFKKSANRGPVMLGVVLAAMFLAVATAPAAADITIPVIRLIYSHQVLGPVVTGWELADWRVQHRVPCRGVFLDI
jgi:hypothetical protein